MVKEISIPVSVLEEIAYYGDREAPRDREASGILVGYEILDNRIEVSKGYNTQTKKGKPTLASKVYDHIKWAVSLPKILGAVWLSIMYMNKIKKDGFKPIRIDYHTHPSGTWSEGDFRASRKIESLYNKMGVGFISLVYISDENLFQAMDGKGNEIPISILNK